jgi:peptide/nickel transport system permease protein
MQAVSHFLQSVADKKRYKKIAGLNNRPEVIAFLKNRMAITGLAIVLLLALVMVLAPYIAPHDPVEQKLDKRFLSPCLEYPMGTDDLGRCMMSRIIYGARLSLEIAFITVAFITSIGIAAGLISGYYGGIVDDIIMRFVDMMLAFPGIILALVIAGVLGPDIINVMLALILVSWTGMARVVRGSVLSVKEKDFVEAARAVGCGNLYIMRRHILPNVMAPVIVMATFDMAFIILAISGMSFLGLGAQPPTPEWGSMLNHGREFMRTAPFLMICPGSAIMVSVLAFNFLGDGLRDAIDPKYR